MAPTIMHAPTANPSTPPNSGSSAGTRHTQLEIELSCLMCGRELGILESDAWPAYGQMVLRHSHRRAVLITDWVQLRCSNCGGAAMPGEITHRQVRTEAPFDWSSEQPRRGRPPKLVVAQRVISEANG